MSSVSTIVRESINNDYEWIQYNNDLRIIRSKKDDMFHAQSILNALGSNKQLRRWFKNDQTKELIKGFKEELKINDDSKIIEDLGADSLDMVEMLMTLEDEYGISISDEDAVNLKTVSDIMKYIEK